MRRHRRRREEGRNRDQYCYDQIAALNGIYFRQSATLPFTQICTISLVEYKQLNQIQLCFLLSFHDSSSVVPSSDLTTSWTSCADPSPASFTSPSHSRCPRPSSQTVLSKLQSLAHAAYFHLFQHHDGYEAKSCRSLSPAPPPVVSSPEVASAHLSHMFPKSL